MKTIKINNITIKNVISLPGKHIWISKHPNGNKYWYLNDDLHREDGPAIMSKDVKCWYINGKRHRVAGPAVERTNGTKEFWFNGKLLSNKNIDFLLNLGYPIKSAITLVYFYENNKNK